MAQLPPKIPSMTQNWAPFPHHRMSSMANFTHPPPSTSRRLPPPQHQASTTSCWMDEFLDFSSSRRGAHRRSASDSIAFMESPLNALDEECGRNPTVHGSNNIATAFDRLDDDQLMSMFSDDIAVPPTVTSSSNPSTPREASDDQLPAAAASSSPRASPARVESSCDPHDPHSQSHAPPPPTSPADPKRVKRILANRQSAQRSRVRKAAVHFRARTQRHIIAVGVPLKQRIAALAQDKLFKDAHQEALKKEIERLRQVYHHQTLKKMENQNAAPQQQQQQLQDTITAQQTIMLCTDHKEQQQILN
ncbi:hypothetical protein M0R45_014725 [Rubus argutus]|uniref:BZIP domain-containing protein n=1 Tax=Rubus argutus TaxID=59490 RepID=A0AAW1XME1_RUBAR